MEEKQHKEKWESEFDKLYRASVFQAYPDSQESHAILLNDIKSFIRQLLEEERIAERNRILEELPKPKEHACSFNDGEWACHCYKVCLEKIKTIINNERKT